MIAPFARFAPFALLAGLLAAPTLAVAQDVLVPAAAPSQATAIPLDTGVSADLPAEQWMTRDGRAEVRNVSRATLMPFLPPRGRATGAAVVVAPGGAFLGLAMEAEGYAVARWLADHGVAAFVLKYRLQPTPADFATFAHEIAEGRAGRPTSVRPPADTPPAALADARAALALVRARAGDWGVDPQRVGMMGFSAGAMTTLSTLTLPAAERPAFLAPIYGPLGGRPVPADAPPLFAAIAADDFFLAKSDLGLVSAWHAAKRPVEFHLFSGGGHGFGLGRAGTTTDGWIAGFDRWLRAGGWLAAPAGTPTTLEARVRR